MYSIDNNTDWDFLSLTIVIAIFCSENPIECDSNRICIWQFSDFITLGSNNWFSAHIFFLIAIIVITNVCRPAPTQSPSQKNNINLYSFMTFELKMNGDIFTLNNCFIVCLWFWLNENRRCDGNLTENFVDRVNRRSVKFRIVIDRKKKMKMKMVTKFVYKIAHHQTSNESSQSSLHWIQSQID